MLSETLQSVRLPAWRNETKSPLMVKKHSSELCRKLHLTSHQRQLCLQGGDGLAEVLLDAIRISASFCQHQFQNDRWNCALNESYRLPVLQKGIGSKSFKISSFEILLKSESCLTCTIIRLYLIYPVLAYLFSERSFHGR